MNHKNLVIFFVTVLFLMGACNLPARISQGTAQPSNPTGSTPATQAPLSGGNGEESSQTATQPPEPTPTQVLPSPTPTLGIGSQRTSTTDGMIQVFVPAGQFIMGTFDAVMSAPVYLDAFWIDQTEVTNAMFAKFVAATNYRTDAEKYGDAYVFHLSSTYEYNYVSTPGANWQHPHGPASNIKGLDQYPVVQVSWNDAVAFCKWAGERLPTEAEWEKAARGTDGRLYPWGGQDWAGNLANFMDKQLNPTYTVDDGHAGIAPVGSYPDGASPYGALDMAGNVAEWVEDWYADAYPQGDQTTLMVNPQGLATGEERGMRGGAWTSNDDNNGEKRLSSHRNYNLPDYSGDSAGFRCVASQ